MHKTKCPDCSGYGVVTVEITRPHNFNRDIGYIDTKQERCDRCEGDGEVPLLCNQCEEPTDRPKASICSDCLEENYK